MQEKGYTHLVGFVDLHSHVLPGLDDGAPDAATSMAMLRGLRALGFDTVCATPHQKADQFMPSLDAIREAHAATKAALVTEGVTLALPLAAENMWDGVFFERLERGAIPAYDDGEAFLFELPLLPSLPAGLFERLFAARVARRLPVLAHPERYEALWKDWDLVDKLRTQCALVVDLGAVGGYHGRRRNKMARAMLQRGVAHAAASDAHSMADVQAAAQGIAWIHKKLGAAAVQRLLEDNPRRILTGEHPEE